MPSRDAFFAALGSLPAAIALLTALRWPDGITCPHCGSGRVGGHSRYDRCRDLPRYRCKATACRPTFLLTTGTPLACSRLPLPDSGCVRWLIVLGLPAWCACREFDRYVPLSSQVCADSARCDTLLSAIGCTVEQVNHGAGEYARGDVHENTAECEIGLLQQFLLAHRGISMTSLPSYLKLHQFRRNERERPYREQACLLLAALLGQGPGPRCLLPAAWAPGREVCEVWRPPREKIEEAVPALAA